MLSKYKFYKKNLDSQGSFDLDINIYKASLKHFKKKSLEPSILIKKSLLGLCFLGKVDTRTVFFKCVSPHYLQHSIYPEFLAISNAYPFIFSDYIKTNEASPVIEWLVVDELQYHNRSLEPEDIFPIINYYSGNLSKNFIHLEGANLPDFVELVDVGFKSLDSLLIAGLLDLEIYKKVDRLLNILRDKTPSLPKCICHGDLSPQNIMTNGESNIAIDWGDVFWGVEGYDFIYWLSFMANRKFLSSYTFGRTSLGKSIETCLLLLIIVIKCEISRLSGEYKNYKLTFQSRISEVLNYAEI